MKYIAIRDAVSRERLAYLENAYSIGYTTEYGKLWTARFSLPLGDKKRRYCRYFNLVEMFDGDEYVGLFRIMPMADTHAGESSATYECEHVQATLMDDVLLGWHEIGNIGVFTRDVLAYILAQQTTQRWVLGDCDFDHQYLYGWEDENLLAALFSVPKPFAEEYRWEFDTTAFPWTLHLRRAPDKVAADLRYKKNMIGITKSVDPSQLCTRLYAYGYGEGVNALNFTSLNGGRPYMDSPNMAEYGLVARIWKDGRYQDAQSLYDAARAMLARLERPLVSYEVSGVHAGRLAECTPGDMVRVVDPEEGTDVYSRIVSISKSDVTGAPKAATIKIANESRSIASSVADLADRQRVESVYSQGSTSLFADSFYDNCSPQFPATIRFFIPENAVHVNQVLVDVRVAPFRGYTQAIQDGGGVINIDTQIGGKQATSDVSGGGLVAVSYTAQSGGSAVGNGSPQAINTNNSNAFDTAGAAVTVNGSTGPTAAASGDTGGSSPGTGGPSTSNTAGASVTSVGLAGTTDTGIGGSDGHRHNMNHSHGIDHTHGLNGHTHSVSSHSHSMNSHTHGLNNHTHGTSSHAHSVPAHNHPIPSHYHQVQVQDHSHTVNLPGHSHQFTLNNHTHQIQHGIYQGPSAGTLTLRVNGRTVGAYGSSIASVNIVPYMGTGSAGKIPRGWHTIEIVPNNLTRVECNLSVQLFANSRGGSQN